MKRFALPLALAAALAAAPVHAHSHEGRGVTLNGFTCEDPAYWADRVSAREARAAITTIDGKVTLVLTDDVLAMQLSERTMRKVERELHKARHEHEDDDGVIGEAIKTAVLGAVHSLLDHSAECRLRDVRDVRWESGRLVIVARDGQRLFEKVEVDDEDVLESFDAAEAREFVREFRRLRGLR